MSRTVEKLLLLLIGTTIGFGVAEVTLRLLGVGYETILRPDPHRGWSLQPGAVGWDWAAREYVQINGDGLRDLEHDRRKPPGTWRLAVLGDSFTQGREAKLEHIFPRRLEPRLRACPVLAARDPEVLNFGVRGYGTVQELLTLRHQAWDYDPDAVLLAFYVGNDVADNHPELAMDADLRPYFRYGDDGRLTTDFGFRDSERYRLQTNRAGRLRTRLKSHLRTWQFASRMELLLRVNMRRSERDDTPSDRHRRYLIEGIVPGVLVPPTDPKWEEAWKITEELLLLVRDEVQSRGRRLFVFTVSAPLHVHPDPDRRRAEAEALGVPDLLYPERRLTEFAARNDIAFFPLIAEMQRRAEEKHVYLHGSEDTGKGFGHWNPQGHALVAELLGERICATLAGRHGGS